MFTIVRHVVLAVLLSINSWVGRIEHELSGKRDVYGCVCHQKMKTQLIIPPEF